jgi:hypothetical protein
MMIMMMLVVRVWTMRGMINIHHAWVDVGLVFLDNVLSLKQCPLLLLLLLLRLSI